MQAFQIQRTGTEFIANEGIRISSIIQFVVEQGANLSDEQKLLLNDIVKEWEIHDHTGEEMHRRGVKRVRGMKGRQAMTLNF